MTTIQVKCVDQNLQILNSPLVASGGLQETAMQFDFCSKWDGLAKTVVFYRDKNKVYNVMLDAENKCMIPDEIMRIEGRIYFGVYGVSEGKRKTTFILKYDVKEGAFLEGSIPREPTPSIYEQLLTNYGEAMQKVEDFQEETRTKIETFEATTNKAIEDFKGAVNKTVADYTAEVNKNIADYTAEVNKNIAETTNAVNDLNGKVIDRNKITYSNGVLTIDLD